MKCEHCGANIDKASNFCPVCGSKLSKNEPDKQENQEDLTQKKSFSNLLNFKFNKRSKDSDEKTGADLIKSEENDNIIKNESHSQAEKSVTDENVESEPLFEKNDRDFLDEPIVNRNKLEELGKDDPNSDDKKPNPADRMDKESRMYENLGGKSSPLNKRSVIEEVQAKVSMNASKEKKKTDYSIDENKSSMLNKNIEDRVEKIINGDDIDLSNLTLSEGIRKIPKKSKIIISENKGEELIGPSQGQEILRPNKEENKTEANKLGESQNPSKAKNQSLEAFKDKYVTRRNLLIALIGLLIALILGTLYIKMNKAEDITIPLSDYITLTYEGEDGQAVPKASIDTEKLIAAYGNDIKYISRDNNKGSYDSPAQEFAADLQNNVVFQYSKDNGLSNGDEITVMANLDNIKISDKYNVLMSNASKAVIIDGIKTDDFTDPFTYINVKFEGQSPNMTLTAGLTDDAPEFMHTIDIIPAKSNGITEGEEVAVSLNFNADVLKETYNVSLSPTSKNFTAKAGDGESSDTSGADSEYISTTAHLNDEMLGDLKYKAGELIKQTILYKNIINVDKIDYLGSFTGIKDDGSGDIKNKVYLIYEVSTSERLPDSNFQSSFKYYTFVEYQNVKKAKDADGKFYTGGPITTDNQIFHKFFVESDYKYYQIEYQGFGFIDKALANVGQGLEGLSVTEDNKTNINNHFATSDGAVGEYEANGRRISLKADGSLVYQIDKAVHLGSYSDNGGEISATIKGVNVDTPIILKYENGKLNAESQGEFDAISFSKIENF